jgi:hypothetical protein
MIKEQLREKIVERIKGGVGDIPTNRQIVAIKKLKSGDLAVYVDSSAAKKKIKSIIN